MREVPSKQLPSTLPAALAEIRRSARTINTLRRTCTVLEDKLVALTTERVTLLGIRPSQIPAHPLITKINA